MQTSLIDRPVWWTDVHTHTRDETKMHGMLRALTSISSGRDATHGVAVVAVVELDDGRLITVDVEDLCTRAPGGAS